MAAAAATRALACGRGPSQARRAGALCLQSSPRAGPSRPSSRTPKPRILPRGAHGQGPAALTSSPVRCSPNGCAPRAASGLALDPSLVPPWLVRGTANDSGERWNSHPRPRESCRKCTSGSRSRGPMRTTKAEDRSPSTLGFKETSVEINQFIIFSGVRHLPNIAMRRRMLQSTWRSLNVNENDHSSTITIASDYAES